MNDQSMTTSQTTQRTRGTPATFTMNDIKKIERMITDAPVPARPIGAADALISLAPALHKARERGHSLAGLVQLCEAQGLYVSERAVSRAISTARANKTTKKKTVAST